MDARPGTQGMGMPPSMGCGTTGPGEVGHADAVYGSNPKLRASQESYVIGYPLAITPTTQLATDIGRFRIDACRITGRSWRASGTLRQGLSLMPMTDEMFDAVTDGSAEGPL
ncbi:hypothetical protein [Streptomyces sp. NPDC055287]